MTSKIAVCVQMMDEMKLPFASEPGKARELRLLHVIFLVKKDVRIK